MELKKTQIVQFKATDDLLLPGLLSEPHRKTDKVAINLHGNGSASVFYSFDRFKFFAEELNKRNISFLTFNNRGAHYIKRLKYDDEDTDDIKLGTTYEIIKDCIKDIDGALVFLEALGYKEFFLMGHSTGANKICVYNYYKPKNKFSKYVLAAGGDDTGILMNWMGGPKKLKQCLAKAIKEIDKGNGRKLIPKYILDYMLSYQSFYDTCNPDGDYNTFPFYEYMNNLNLSKKKLFREYKSISKPALVVYGENDEYCYDDVEGIVGILKKEAPGKTPFDFEIIKDTDHGFSGKEKDLAVLVSEWLNK